MKLAAALIERADLQRRIEGLSARLQTNARVQENDTPSENPAELLEELDRLLAALEAIMTRINLTNSRTMADGKTLTELLARRDCLSLRLKTMRTFLERASARAVRSTSTEIRILPTVNVRELQKVCDRYSRELRETDELIQSINWTTELM